MYCTINRVDYNNIGEGNEFSKNKFIILLNIVTRCN